MTPYFTRRKETPLRERRRRRWSEQMTPILFAAGIVLDQLARPGIIESFPDNWRPYIRGASAAFGLTALAAMRESYADHRRYMERLQTQQPKLEDTGT